MPKALITGDAGFVGSHFYWHLRQQGCWTIHTCDIARDRKDDARELFRTVSDYYYDLVIHCAAIVGGRKVIDGAPLALASNLELDAALFQWALQAHPGRVVYFSSSAAYPAYLQEVWSANRLKESDLDPSLTRYTQGTPDQLYGWAKLTGENLAYRYRQEGGKVSVVRPFSGYGEKQANTYPFPKFIDRAKARQNPFEIWGTGRQTRDFIHIDDIVGAVMTMYRERIDGPVNLGWGDATALGDLAMLICEQVGYSPEFKFLGDEPSGVGYRVSDNSKMLEFYQPKVTLEEGIRRALAYR